MLKEKALAELIAYTVKKFKLKALEEIGLRTAISKAYSDLLDRAENFGLKNEDLKFLDKTLFKKPECIDEYMGFFDLKKAYKNPDVKKLYEIYKETFGNPQKSRCLPEDIFKSAFDYFWSILVVELKSQEVFKERFRDRILNLLDSHVTSQEVKDYIKQYCENAYALREADFSRGLSYTDEYSEKYRFVIPTIEWSASRFIAEPKPVDIVDEILPLKKNRIVFQGNAGVGKTTFMLWLEKELLKKGKLALYFRASEITSDTDKHLTEKIITELKDVFRENIPEQKMKGLVRELKSDGKIIFIIDAFDQTADENIDVINTTIKHIKSNCPVFISTRQYSLERLEGCRDSYYIAEVKEFDKKQLEEYFGPDDYKKAAHLTGKAEGLINIPLLAGFIKYLILSGESRNINTKTELFQSIISRLIEKEKINTQRARKTVSRHKYRDMAIMLEDISLKSLRKGHKGYFMGEEVRGHSEYLDLFEETQFIKHIVDYEGYLETKHHYQHPNFQEYYASLKLYRLYRGGEYHELYLALSDINYSPEIGLFFSEITAQETNDPAKEFAFWQEALEAEDDENRWVRTYALQVRDNLGEDRAKTALARLVKKEQEEINLQISQAAEKLKSNAIKAPEDMVIVPAGIFIRGSYEHNSEWPVRRIYINYDYCIDKYPVTNKEYCEFLNDEKPDDKDLNKWIELEGSYEDERCRIRRDRGKYIIEKGYEKHPVIYVTRDGADAYAKGKGKRLPTEAEWEKAARGLYGRRYPWGNEFDKEKCNAYESGNKKITLVDKYDKYRGPFGCSDMAGNVWEWCEDHYRSDFYEKSDTINPVCDKGEHGEEVLRGGSWSSSQIDTRCAYRFRYFPEYRVSAVGFRCARTPVK